MKFGGSVLRNGKCILKASEIVRNHCLRGNEIIVVVSALRGVTDKLLEMSIQARDRLLDELKANMEEMKGIHMKAAKEAIKNYEIRGETINSLNSYLRELENILTGIFHLGELTSRSQDYILSFGEKMATAIMNNTLRNLNLKTVFLTGKEVGIVTDSNFGNAKPLMNLTAHNVKGKLEPLITKGITPVITGFIAANQKGVVTTMGRGGSDFTATVIGASMAADEVWLWTEVNGLMTADPKVVPSAKTISRISFSEAVEMAVLGAKKMHPRALEPAMQANIPVRIKNAFKPHLEGTLIVRETELRKGEIVKAVTLVRDVSLITVSGSEMIGRPGTAAAVFEVLGKSNINVMMISQSVSEANISLVISRKDLEKALNSLEIKLLGSNLIQGITSENDVAVIAVVGAGMKGTPGVAARVFKAVARKGVNVIMIAQGSSELNISFVVKEKDSEKAVRALHEEFNLERIK